MGELIKAGKVKHWGVSNETTFGICQLCETAKRLGVPLPVSIQVGVYSGGLLGCFKVCVWWSLSNWGCVLRRHLVG